MDRIDDQIFIGNYLDARNEPRLRANQVRSILCLDGSLKGTEPSSLGVEELAVFLLRP